MTRVAVIGARRQRQGLGPYMVHALLAAGVDVPCFLATSTTTRDATEVDLRERFGVAPRGFLDLDTMLTGEPVDALAICSPPETHETYLEAALAAGLHVLCEKPLVWGGPAMAATSERIVGEFEARELLLRENCQWPYTLEAFGRLHPGVLHERDSQPVGTPLREFEVHMQPGSRGLQMIGDALPHVLSLLQVLAPDPQPKLEELRFSNTDPRATRLDVGFFYRTRTGRANVQVHLEHADSYPREAELVIGDRHARRLVAPEGYRLSFADGDRSVPVSDPLGLLVADFARELGGRGDRVAAPRSQEIVVRMQLLESIATAFVSPGGSAGD